MLRYISLYCTSIYVNTEIEIKDLWIAIYYTMIYAVQPQPGSTPMWTHHNQDLLSTATCCSVCSVNYQPHWHSGKNFKKFGVRNVIHLSCQSCKFYMINTVQTNSVQHDKYRIWLKNSTESAWSATAFQSTHSQSCTYNSIPIMWQQ